MAPGSACTLRPEEKLSVKAQATFALTTKKAQHFWCLLLSDDGGRKKSSRTGGCR